MTLGVTSTDPRASLETRIWQANSFLIIYIAVMNQQYRLLKDERIKKEKEKEKKEKAKEAKRLESLSQKSLNIGETMAWARSKVAFFASILGANGLFVAVSP